MNVYKLTETQKDLLIGQKWNNQAFFNPTQDADGNWFISQEEVNGCIFQTTYPFLANLELIPYNPVVIEFPL